MLEKSSETSPEATGTRSGVEIVLVKLCVLGDLQLCGGVQNMDKSLSGNLINNLKLAFKCQWKVIAKSGANSIELIDFYFYLKKTKFYHL